jgi:hypothetical protein
MRNKYGTYYQYSTGSITGNLIKIWRWTVPVWPTNDGRIWTYDPDTGEQVIIDG